MSVWILQRFKKIRVYFICSTFQLSTSIYTKQFFFVNPFGLEMNASLFRVLSFFRHLCHSALRKDLIFDRMILRSACNGSFSSGLAFLYCFARDFKFFLSSLIFISSVFPASLYWFLSKIIDHSFTLLIGCCKQPVKCAALFILVICEDISNFFNIWIAPNYSFAQFLSSCPVRSSCRTRVSGFVRFFLVTPPPQKSPLSISKRSKQCSRNFKFLKERFYWKILSFHGLLKLLYAKSAFSD